MGFDSKLMRSNLHKRDSIDGFSGEAMKADGTMDSAISSKNRRVNKQYFVSLEKE